MVDEVLVLPIYEGKPRRWIALVEKDILDIQTLQKRAEVLFDLYSKGVRTFSFNADPLQTYGRVGVGDLVEIISKKFDLKATARVITIEISESSRGLSTRYEVGSPEWKLEEFVKSLSPRVFQKYDVGQAVGLYHGTTVDPTKNSPAVTYFALPSELLETVMLYMDVVVKPYISRYETDVPLSVSDEHTHDIVVKVKTGTIASLWIDSDGYLRSNLEALVATTSGGATSHTHNIKVHSPYGGEELYIDDTNKRLVKASSGDVYFSTEETEEHTHLFKVYGGSTANYMYVSDTNEFMGDISADVNVTSTKSEVTTHIHPIKPTHEVVAGQSPENVKVEITTPTGSTHTINIGSGALEKKAINLGSIFKEAGLYKMTWKTDTMATINFIIYGQILIRSVVY